MEAHPVDVRAGLERSGAPRLAAVGRQEPQSVVVARHLLQYLLSGHFRQGDRIPSERQLAETLEVGRANVREAIKSLSLLGLLTVRQGDGTYLTESTSSLLPEVIEWGLLLGERRVDDLVEARTNLETFTAELAAGRGSAEQLEQLRAHLQAMSESGSDLARYTQADMDFHLQVAEMSGNEVLVTLASSLRSLLRVWVSKVVAASGDTALLAAEHAPILEAIAEHDGQRARAAMAEHLHQASCRLRETVPRGETTAAGPAEGAGANR